MNLKHLKNFIFAPATPVVLGLTMFSLTSVQTAQAAQFSFESGTIWDHSAVGGNSSNNGWQGGQTQGTATVDGITLTVISTFVNASASSNNLKIQDTGNTDGFVLGNNNQSDDGNSSSLTNYQRVDFTFDIPVNFTAFKFGDIDTDEETNPSNSKFVDALGVEGFTTSAGTIGTGLPPVYDLADSELADSTIGGVSYISRDIATYGKDNVGSEDVQGQARISFNQGVQVASVYFFNDLNSAQSGDHSINLFNATLDVQEVPFEFSPSLGLLISLSSLFGINYLRKKRDISQPN